MALDMTGIKIYEVGEQIITLMDAIIDFEDPTATLFGGRISFGFARPENLSPSQFPCAFIWNGEGDKTGDARGMSEYSDSEGFVIAYFNDADSTRAYKKLLLFEKVIDKAINLKGLWANRMVTVKTSGFSIAPN